jgi:hypothetical protein
MGLTQPGQLKGYLNRMERLWVCVLCVVCVYLCACASVCVCV